MWSPNISGRLRSVRMKSRDIKKEISLEIRRYGIERRDIKKCDIKKCDIAFSRDDVSDNIMFPDCGC